MDLTKLKTVSSYAAMIGKSTAWVWYLIKTGELKHIYIDTKCFVVIE